MVVFRSDDFEFAGADAKQQKAKKSEASRPDGGFRLAFMMDAVGCGGDAAGTN